MNEASGWRLLGRALKHRNYRLFFGGQAVSLLGTWMQQIAFGWLVYRLTEDARLMGLVSFAGQIPSFVLLPFAGVLLDRWSRYHVVLAMQALAMVQALLLAALVLGGVVAVWHLFVAALFLGCVTALDLPGRQALLPQLVADKEDFANAIALNSFLFNSARLVGPGIAGVLVGLWASGTGEGICFLVNGASYLAVLLALFAVELPASPSPPEVTPLWRGFAEGYAYVFRAAPIRGIVLLVAWIGLLGMPYMVLLPLVADERLGGGAGTYGFLVTAAGLGAVSGAIFLASRRGIHGASLRIVVTGSMLAFGLIGLSQIRDFCLALPVMVVIGAGMMLTMVSCSTIVQTIVPDEMRGRVMSLYSLAFMGLTPFGNLLVGWLAYTLDTPATLLICGGGCLAGVALFALSYPHSEPRLSGSGVQDRS